MKKALENEQYLGPLSVLKVEKDPAAFSAKPLEILHLLEKTYPEASCALHFNNPFQLLVATILSAQCTDVCVNKVTSGLFLSYPDASSLARADVAAVEKQIHAAGFFRTKARNLIGCARMLCDRFGGGVPCSLEDLIQLPGVGRKTANVVLGNAFQVPGFAVDTHVKRVSFRLGWTEHTDPEKIEKDLCRLLPEEKWVQASHVLIFHGRRTCKAPVPVCSVCRVARFCLQKGVKKKR